MIKLVERKSTDDHIRVFTRVYWKSLIEGKRYSGWVLFITRKYYLVFVDEIRIFGVEIKIK